MALHVLTSAPEGAEKVLSREALAFLESLHRQFESRRQELLAARAERQKAFDRGEMPDFLPATKSHPRRRLEGGADAQGPPAPPRGDHRPHRAEDDDQRPQLGGGRLHGRLRGLALALLAERDRSASRTASSPSAAPSRSTSGGKSYRLNDQTAVLLVRPRGWHLPEKHVTVDGTPISASLFDFGLYFFHNARALLDRGTGPYFYLPKMESHLEARLWNEVFVAAQEALKIPRGTIRATMLIETLPAAFEMEEILYELREHASGLNAGRWDYMFSFIKKFRNRKDMRAPGPRAGDA